MDDNNLKIRLNSQNIIGGFFISLSLSYLGKTLPGMALEGQYEVVRNESTWLLRRKIFPAKPPLGWSVASATAEKHFVN